jgi:hypothetical protein
MPQVGDRFIPQRSERVYEIFHVHRGGDQVDLHLPRIDLLHLRMSTDTLTFIERKPGSIRTGRQARSKTRRRRC